jgi:ABC-type Fe3+-hydroxamate transport system substrate-binding protein
VDFLVDNLGDRVPLSRPPIRVVSLVPSLTEAIAATCPERLVGATDWCVQPADLQVPRVRGTKNPDHAAIVALRPDLVVANQEENRAVDVARLRSAGIPVWVTVVESVAGALVSLRQLLTQVLAAPMPGWLEEADASWAEPAPPPSLTAIVPIWRDPWMVVGPRTYADDLLRHLGIANLFGGDDGDDGKRGDRYPRVALPDLLAARPDVVVLPDEPYAFSPDDGPEAFPDSPVALVTGRALTWYGPAMVTAGDHLGPAIEGALGR